MDIVSRLAGVIGSENVSYCDSELQSYGVDRTTIWEGNPKAVLFPRSVKQLQDIILFANKYSLKVVPSGGRTGLCGGAVANNSELVVSMDKMNIIKEINLDDRSITAEAGVTTQQIQVAAAENHLFYPVDFASSGSSQIGGNIATNAGGINVIRYGMTRNWILGLRVVTGSGDILNLNKSLVKNNTGYDFRHLFIGSEGTLGIICEATLQLTEPPKPSTVCVFGVEKFAYLIEVLKICKSMLQVNAFEFFCNNALSRVVGAHQYQRPFDTQSPFYALVELENTEIETETVFEVYSKCVDEKLITDGVISQSIDQARALWRLREDISETLWHFQPYKNDISVRISKMADFLNDVSQLIQKSYPDFEIIWYGHIGDGNIHLNILKPKNLSTLQFKSFCDGVSMSLGELISKYEGSISAEHGVGLLKKESLRFSRSEDEINLMKSIKKIFDPNAILNPGKLI